MTTDVGAPVTTTTVERQVLVTGGATASQLLTALGIVLSVTLAAVIGMGVMLSNHINRSIDQVHDRFDQVDRRFVEVDRRFVEINTRLDRIEASLMNR